VEQCVYIKDGDCTRKNCQETLKTFLVRTTPSSSSPQQQQQQQQQQPYPRRNGDVKQLENRIPNTLIFYYGGHGSANGFATIGGTWGYEQVAQTIQELFHGDRVLFLLDCCASGNLWRYLSYPSFATNISAKKQYVLLATSQPYITSSADGEEWILTNTWIQLMRHHRAADKCCDDEHLELEKMISILADRHVFELGDLFFAYLTTTRPSRNSPCEIGNSWSWMPALCRRQRQIIETSTSSLSSSQAWLSPSEYLSWSDKPNQIPRQAKILSIHDCRVGDAVAYKHPGGYPLSLTASESTLPSSIAKQEEPLSLYVPPLWLNGTIVSIFENGRGQKEAETKDSDSSDYSDILLRIRVWYPSQIKPWEVEVSHRSPRLINHYFVAQTWMLPRAFLETQVMLAQKYQQHLDGSVVANTPVRVALGRVDDGDNDGTLEGTILDWKDFKWKRLLHSCTDVSSGTTGYDEYYWDELPVPVKTAAIALGYTRSSWDKDTGIPADSMNWGELSRVQKDATTVLGYTRQRSSSSPSVESTGCDDLDFDLNNRKASFSNNVWEISTCSGSHVPVEWNHNHEPSLVPLKQIIFPNAERNNVYLNIAMNTMVTPRSSLNTKLPGDDDGASHLQWQSLIRGLESSGKSIGNAKYIFGTTELSAFWVDDENWYDATPIDIGYHYAHIGSNNKEVSLDLLATHFEYTLPGLYCPIEYEGGVQHLIPFNYIFRRGCHPQQVDDTDSDNDGDTEETTLTNSIPMEEVIDEITRSILDISLKASSFGNSYSEAVVKLEEASKLISASFERSNDDQSKSNYDQSKIEQNEGNVDKPSSNSATSRSTAEILPNQYPTKSYLDYYWSDLPGYIKTVARRIGYDKKLWDFDGRIPIELKEWKDLAANEKKDLNIIGYNETKWCNKDDSDSSDDDY
jgi:hypothetical protein